jgi:hypothetical protein
VPFPASTVDAAPSTASENPFADLDTAVEPSPSRSPRPSRARAAEPEELLDEEPPRKPRKAARDERDEPDERPARADRARQAPGDSGTLKVALLALAVYAVIATVLAVYGLFIRSGDKLEPGHPLSTIPDNFGEFDPPSRKKVTQYKFPVDGELPAAQRAGLGQTVSIGQLEVQPVRVEKRRLGIVLERPKGPPQPPEFTNPALVLTLSIRNTGDLAIYPMDPAFTRRATANDKPITRLVVGKETFAGGYIEWPLDPERIRKKIEVQQANDSIPLRPGETREYVVFTDAKPEIVGAVETATEPVQWRVEVRRGLIEFRGEEIPVTAIIGVDFKGSDVKTPG